MPVIKSLLNYYPIQVGNTRLIFSEKDNEYKFYEGNNSWMGYDLNSFWQSTEFSLELKLAKGVCVTTGLGLGIIQTHLLTNPKVSKVVVYEKNPEAIEIFYKIIEYNKFDISNLVIINQDANTMKGENCDCLFLDHYANESEISVIRSVKTISENNEAGVLWYWPAANHLIRFSLTKQLALDNDCYSLWKTYTQIKNLPESLSDIDLELVNELKDIYKTKVQTRLGHRLNELEERNKLINHYKRNKS